MSETTLAWHFVDKTLRDGRPIPKDGVWLKHKGELVMCKSGLHASVRPIDALRYAPGNTLCRVEVRGAKHADDKLVARERRILWRFDAEPMLREFARRCALDVIHLWDAPDVVRRFLETGDESLSAAAEDAAWAAWAAWAVAAAWAAWDAAWAAAWDAAWAAVRDAARDARDAVVAAAARAAAWDAWDARADARDKQNTDLLAGIRAYTGREEL